MPGRTVNRMSGACPGEAKTNARDAYVITETAHHRSDFTIIDVPAQLAADLALLTAHRSDLVADRVRMTMRLRDTFDYSNHKGAPVPLTGYRTPASIRRRGRARLTAWPAARGVRGADAVAKLVTDLATQLLAPDEPSRFPSQHPQDRKQTWKVRASKSADVPTRVHRLARCRRPCALPRVSKVPQAGCSGPRRTTRRGRDRG